MFTIRVNNYVLTHPSHLGRKSRILDIQAIFVRNGLTVLEVPAQDPEIHGPTAIRDSVMLVRARPTLVPELNPSSGISFLETKPDTGARPVIVCPRHLKLELGVRDASGHPGTPIVVGPEPELIL